jgi:hypothetical protein
MQAVFLSIRMANNHGAASSNQSDNVSCVDRIAAMSETPMPLPQFAPTRTDGTHIGSDIRRLVQLMLEEGLTWRKAADAVGVSHRTASRALGKAHVRAHMRIEKARLIEELSMTVPTKLHSLMDAKNANAAVRACIAHHDMAASVEPGRHSIGVASPGLTIQIVTPDEPKTVTIDNPVTPPPAPPFKPPVTIGHQHAPQLIERADENE